MKRLWEMSPREARDSLTQLLEGGRLGFLPLDAETEASCRWTLSLCSRVLKLERRCKVLEEQLAEARSTVVRPLLELP